MTDDEPFHVNPSHNLPALFQQHTFRPSLSSLTSPSTDLKTPAQPQHSKSSQLPSVDLPKRRSTRIFRQLNKGFPIEGYSPAEIECEYIQIHTADGEITESIQQFIIKNGQMMYKRRIQKRKRGNL